MEILLNVIYRNTYGIAAMQGRRKNMQDATESHLDKDHAFFGVYDGHGPNGGDVSDFAKHNLRSNCYLNYAKEDNNIQNALRYGFLTTHENLDDSGYHAGSTATVAVIKNGKIFVANTGDSRTVLCSNGEAIPLSNDHKPYRSDEWQRIIAAGGYVVHVKGAHRVKGCLAMSRALGDKFLHPYVIPDPEITQRTLGPQDEFLILASDGVWNVLDNDDAVSFVRSKMIEFNDNCHKAAEALVDHAYSLRSTDNITAIIVNLKVIANQ